MKNIINLRNIISFFIGVVVCYISLQYQFFEIKKELDIPNVVTTVLTLLIGWHIADSLQRRVNRNQNEHTYLIGKLDELWKGFIKFSENLSYDTKVSASDIGQCNKNVTFHLPVIKSIFHSFDLKDTSICELEDNLVSLEKFLEGIGPVNNVIDFSGHLTELNDRIRLVHKGFSEALKAIQDL